VVSKRILTDFMLPSGSVVVTAWSWDYENFAFVPGSPPVWHQPQVLPGAINAGFIVPSPAPLDGVFVYFTLYGKSARQIRCDASWFTIFIAPTH
jgi:hypothetical protein